MTGPIIANAADSRTSGNICAMTNAGAVGMNHCAGVSAATGRIR